MLSDPADTTLIADLRKTLEGWETLAEQRGVRIAELEALVEALRCGDLVAFADGELAPDRGEAFRSHLVGCKSCQDDLEADMQLAARLSELAAGEEPE